MTETAVISDRRLEREAAKRRQARRGQAIAAVSTRGRPRRPRRLDPDQPRLAGGAGNVLLLERLQGILPRSPRRLLARREAVRGRRARGPRSSASLIALLRTSRAPALFPLRLLATVFVDLFRGIPTILLVYLVGFGIPALELTGLPTDPVVLGGIALGLSYSAYVAEVYRAGIRSVHRGQRDAALAVGLTEAQAMRHVILPQAVRRVAPPLLNDFVALQKDVALVSILGPQEAFRIAQIIEGETSTSRR